MIEIKLYKDIGNRIVGYNISGHAGYGPRGEDIVCAAVSVLGQTALMSLVEVCGLDENKLEYLIDDEKGLLDVKIETTKDSDISENIQTVLKTLELGIKSIIESYPAYVTLEYREV